MMKNISLILKELKKTNSFRELKNIPEGVLNYSSNDYLGLSCDSKLLSEFYNSLDFNKFVFSTCSSRLLTGNHKSLQTLEKSLSEIFNNDVLLYNSGYHANIGILPAIASKYDLIISDKLVHASIIDGIKLSKAKSFRFRHNDYEHLEMYLKLNRNKFNNIIIVTESLFSMDGDFSDLKKLVEIKNKYNCLLYVDEAHSFGVYGENGFGLAENFNLINDIDFIVGTFGKAFASYGAFVILKKHYKDYLINYSRSLIYSTAIPPINAEWTNFILNNRNALKDKRLKLKNVINILSNELNQKIDSHIVPIIFGSNDKVVKVSNELLRNNIYCLPIRYPTVKKGTERLRLSLNSDVKESDIKNLTIIINKYDWKMAE